MRLSYAVPTGERSPPRADTTWLAKGIKRSTTWIRNPFRQCRRRSSISGSASQTSQGTAHPVLPDAMYLFRFSSSAKAILSWGKNENFIVRYKPDEDDGEGIPLRAKDSICDAAEGQGRIVMVVHRKGEGFTLLVVNTAQLDHPPHNENINMTEIFLGDSGGPPPLCLAISATSVAAIGFGTTVVLISLNEAQERLDVIIPLPPGDWDPRFQASSFSADGESFVVSTQIRSRTSASAYDDQVLTFVWPARGPPGQQPTMARLSYCQMPTVSLVFLFWYRCLGLTAIRTISA